MYGLLGDVLMRTPILNEIKKNYPNSEIFVFVDPIGKQVLKLNPNVTEVIVTDRTKKNRLKYIFNKIKTQLKIYSLNLDLFIDLYGSGSAIKMVKLSGVKYRLGFSNWKVWSTNNIQIQEINDNVFENPFHYTNRLYKILSFLDIQFKQLDTKPFIYSQESTDKSIQEYLRSFQKDNTYIISLGSGGLEKLLELERVYELIQFIYDEYQLIPSIVLNPGQEFLQEEMIKNYLEPNNIDYIRLKSLNIEEVVSLMKWSKFIIVPDTGLYHIAVSVGIPIFSVFAFSNPELVKPSSGITQIYFEPTNNKDPFGLPLGTNKVLMSELKDSFKSFYTQLK